VVFTASHLTDTDKQKEYGRIHKLNTTQIQQTVACYNTRPGKEIGLFDNTPRGLFIH